MTRKLRDVEVLPEHVSQALLATESEDEGDESSLVGEARIEQQSNLTTTPREMGGASS
jgi:hypothetical protein